MKDNITDWALGQYRTQYEDDSITKQDIFYYTYGMLHHTGYRSKYQASLVRGLPHIPMAPDFWAFSKAGRKLADLHLNYDTCPRHDLGEPKNTIPDKPTSIRLGRKENTAGTGPQTVIDPSKLLIDNIIVYDNLPPCKYKVNGRTPVEWLTYVPKKAANGTDRFPFRFMTGVELQETVERLAHVGVESDRIISSLPEEFEVVDHPSFDESLPAMGQQTLDRGTQTRLK